MFGYTRSRLSGVPLEERTYLNAYQCGLCHVLRREYGLPTSLLAGHEGRLLSLLVQQMLND